MTTVRPPVHRTSSFHSRSLGGAGALSSDSVPAPRRGWLWVALSVAVACGGKEGDSGTTTFVPVDSGDPEPECDLSTDADCDGALDADDCDPNDPTAYPGAPEIPYDGADNDCLGDGDLTDVDGDGYDSDRAGGDDCNDGDPSAYPGAPETCNGRDDDCDGFPTTPEEEAADCDSDGYGPGEGGDCNDEDPTVYPGAPDTWYDGVDSNCDGEDDYDQDADGDPSADHGGGDCDDLDPSTYTDAQEVIDGVDNDCDETVDSISLFDAHATYYGTTSSGDGWTGIDAAGLDDLDGDGWRDYALGGPFGSSAAPNCLSADGDGLACNGWVQLMPSSAESSDPPGTVAHGTIEGSQSWLGWKLDNPGDLDGDGMAELIVGAPLADGNGAAFVFSGADLADGGSLTQADSLAKLSGSTYTGLEVGHLLDADGDGIAEVVGSAGFNDQAIGAIPVWAGVWASADVAAGGNLTISDALMIVQGSGTGGEVAGAADFDGDGLGDLVVGDSVATRGTLLFISSADITGSSSYTTGDFSGPMGASGDGFGTHIAILDDIDGDGVPEIAASGPSALAGASVAEGGIVRVLSGTDLLTSTDAAADAMVTIQGTLDYGGLGITGSQAGDLDGDGGDDLITTYLGGSSIGVVRGSAHIFYTDELATGGTYVAEDASTTLTTRFDGDRFGLGGDVFDIDGDGRDDLVTGAPVASSDRGLGVRYMSGW